jgi:hypothetical protein
VANKVWFVVYVIVFIILAPYLYYSNLINQYGVANQPAGFDFPSYEKDFPLIAFFTGLYFAVNYLFKIILAPLFTPFVKSQHDHKVRQRYVDKSSESAAKLVLHLVNFTWGYMTLYKTDWLPPYLLGTGSFEASIANMPFTPCPASIHLLCISFLGQFSAYFIEVLINRDRPDFNETFAHHITAVALTLGMIFVNNRALGATIAWQ